MTDSLENFISADNDKTRQNGKQFFPYAVCVSNQTPMSKHPEGKLTIAALRLRVAINLFKHIILGNLHVPGKHQTSAVFDAIAGKVGECALSGKTWKSWFSDHPQVPKINKITLLDQLVASFSGLTGYRKNDGPTLLSDLVHGGLMQCMLAPSKTKHQLTTLIERASNYQPASPLHLHIDSVEVDVLVDGFCDVPWEVVKEIAAQRILKLLSERWGPRHGSVYSSFSSDMRLQWDAASLEERAKIRESCARLKPDLFENFMNVVPQPDWSKTGIKADVSHSHIYKTLFSLAADSNFMIADRLSSWSLDLATSALAMHALAWTDRYQTFGVRVTEEVLFWAAFSQFLFSSQVPEFDKSGLLPAMDRVEAQWDLASVQTLLGARETYHAILGELGVAPTDVFTVAMQGASAHPLIYN